MSYYTRIKTALHPLAWGLSRGITKNSNLLIADTESVVISDITIVNWKESHFRALLSHLPLNGHRDNAVMRGQLAVIRQALSRFSDGTDTSRYDVFDYAELCWKLGNQEAQKVLGWSRVQVKQHADIKEKLHYIAWAEARGVTTNSKVVTSGKNGVVTDDVTKVTQDWRETHFRALLSHLPLNGHRDNAIMRAQLAVKPDMFLQCQTIPHCNKNELLKPM
ncbi:MAG: hypothetical protein KDI79_15350 [Anaerolineae bacterium]|nr:hypothetical protein [Anaerolineae bacterium]